MRVGKGRGIVSPDCCHISSRRVFAGDAYAGRPDTPPFMDTRLACTGSQRLHHTVLPEQLCQQGNSIVVLLNCFKCKA